MDLVSLFALDTNRLQREPEPDTLRSRDQLERLDLIVEKKLLEEPH